MTVPTLDIASWFQDIEPHVVRATPLLVSIRLASGAWLTGLLWQPDIVVTASGSLPVQQAYTALAAGSEMLAAQSVRRDPQLNLAVLKLVGSAPRPVFQCAPLPQPGEIVLVLEAGQGFAGSGRLSTVRDHHLNLDAPPSYLAEGGPVLTSSGELAGVCVSGLGGEPRLVGAAAVAQLVDAGRHPLIHRGWIGASLQPVGLPLSVRSAAKQGSGRLVLNVQPGGPADQAGLRMGDVLLAIDGIRMNGHGSLRSLLGPERFDRPAEVTLVRNGQLRTANLVVRPQPV